MKTKDLFYSVLCVAGIFFNVFMFVLIFGWYGKKRFSFICFWETKKECSVNFSIQENKETYLDILLETDILTKYNLFILDELSSFADYNIFPTTGYKFLISIIF